MTTKIQYQVACNLYRQLHNEWIEHGKTDEYKRIRVLINQSGITPLIKLAAEQSVINSRFEDVPILKQKFSQNLDYNPVQRWELLKKYLKMMYADKYQKRSIP